jgi:hypothetical protein
MIVPREDAETFMQHTSSFILHEDSVAATTLASLSSSPSKKRGVFLVCATVQMKVTFSCRPIGRAGVTILVNEPEIFTNPLSEIHNDSNNDADIPC